MAITRRRFPLCEPSAHWKLEPFVIDQSFGCLKGVCKHRPEETTLSSKVRIPPQLRGLTDGISTVMVPCVNARDLIHALVSQYPALGRHLLTDVGELLPHAALCAIGEDVQLIRNLDVVIQHGSLVGILLVEDSAEGPDSFDITTLSCFERGDVYRRELVARLRFVASEPEITASGVAEEAALEIERLARACSALAAQIDGSSERTAHALLDGENSP